MITFKKNGIFYNNGINPEHEDYVYEKVDSIIPYLSEIIEFDKNLTMGDFFALLAPDEKMIEKVFGSHMGHYPFHPYLDEIMGGCVPDGREDMEYIECGWVAEQFDYRLFYEKHKDDKEDEGSLMSKFNIDLHEPTEDDVNEVSAYIDVHGWGKYIPLEGEEENYDEDYEPPTHMNYAIEFTPLNRMAHLPLKLDNYIEIRNKNEIDDEAPLVEGNMYFSVFECVGAILSEITFCGLPEDRDKKWQNMVDSVNEAKEKYKDEDDKEGDE